MKYRKSPIKGIQGKTESRYRIRRPYDKVVLSYEPKSILVYVTKEKTLITGGSQDPCPIDTGLDKSGPGRILVR